MIASWAYVGIKAADAFHTKTARPNEMLQTDFPYFLDDGINGGGPFAASLRSGEDRALRLIAAMRAMTAQAKVISRWRSWLRVDRRAKGTPLAG